MHSAKKCKIVWLQWIYLVRSRSRGKVSDCGARGSDFNSRPQQAILCSFLSFDKVVQSSQLAHDRKQSVFAELRGKFW